MKTATVDDLRERFSDLEKWIEAGEEVAVTRCGVVVATLMPPSSSAVHPLPARKLDWARRLKEHPPIPRKKLLTAEETDAFYAAMKRDF